MVGVVVVTHEHGHTPQITANDGDEGLEYGETQGEHGGEQDNGGAKFLRPGEGHGGEHITQKHAARIAQENARGREVIEKKSQQATGHGDACKGDEEILLDQAKDHQGRDTDEGNSGSEAVDAVDKVKRVDQSHNPEDSKERAQDRSQFDRSGQRKSDCIDAKPSKAQKGSHGNLPKEFVSRPHASGIVNDAQQYNAQTSNGKHQTIIAGTSESEDAAEILRVVVGDPRPAVHNQIARNGGRYSQNYEGDGDTESAEERHVALENFAITAAIHGPNPLGEAHDTRHQRQCGHEAPDKERTEDLYQQSIGQEIRPSREVVPRRAGTPLYGRHYSRVGPERSTEPAGLEVLSVIMIELRGPRGGVHHCSIPYLRVGWTAQGSSLVCVVRCVLPEFIRNTQYNH